MRGDKLVKWVKLFITSTTVLHAKNRLFRNKGSVDGD